MAPVSLQIAMADGRVVVNLLTSLAASPAAEMPDVHARDELHVHGDTVRLVILGVPTSRLQEGTMKLKSGPPVKAQALTTFVPLAGCSTISDALRDGSRLLLPVVGIDAAIGHATSVVATDGSIFGGERIVQTHTPYPYLERFKTIFWHCLSAGHMTCPNLGWGC